MKKKLFISLGLFFIVVLASWFFYAQFIKLTLQEVQKSIFKEYDTIEKFTKIPLPVLNKDCVFDLATQTDDFLASIPEFSDYQWDNEKKTATIQLDNGTVLYVERGGCNQFRFYGTLNLENSDLKSSDKQKIFKEALEIGSKLFEMEDYQFFEYALSTGDYEIYDYENEFLLTFDAESYCNAELYFKSNPKTKKVEIKIGFSLCEN